MKKGLFAPALAIAGGLSERGSTRGILIRRVVDGTKVDDTIVVRQRLIE